MVDQLYQGKAIVEFFGRQVLRLNNNLPFAVHKPKAALFADNVTMVLH